MSDTKRRSFPSIMGCKEYCEVPYIKGDNEGDCEVSCIKRDEIAGFPVSKEMI